jgi:RNA recognition motif-containing protein
MFEDQNQPVRNTVPSTRLFIGGLPYRFTEGELLSLFVTFGRIISLKIMHTQWGKSRGIGYIEFDNLDSAINAKKALHNYRVGDDRTIIVDYAKPDPFLTPEGKERHEKAVAVKQQRFSRFHQNQPSVGNSSPTDQFNQPASDKPQSFAKKLIKPVFGATRQSVYDQRTHHSRVGAKFAKRNKN